jgi:competence protein ComEA
MDEAASTTSTSPTASGNPIVTAWPRSAQFAAVVLSALVIALLGVRIAGSSRWGTRPTELTHQSPPTLAIDLNQADRVELLQIPGVGEGLAERILAYRRQHGAFTRVDELARISGVGPATLQKLRPWLYVEAAERPVEHDPEEANMPVRLALAPPTKEKPPPVRANTSKKLAALDQPIDVNAASQEELQKLPGIGPKLAQRIADERDRSRFKSVDDLRRVSGIGPKTLEKLRPFVVVRSASSSVARVED